MYNLAVYDSDKKYASHRKKFWDKFINYHRADLDGRPATVSRSVVENILKKYNAHLSLDEFNYVTFQSEEDAVSFVLEWS